jgi:hypothetical protein
MKKWRSSGLVVHINSLAHLIRKRWGGVLNSAGQAEGMVLPLDETLKNGVVVNLSAWTICNQHPKQSPNLAAVSGSPIYLIQGIQAYMAGDEEKRAAPSEGPSPPCQTASRHFTMQD